MTSQRLVTAVLLASFCAAALRAEAGVVVLANRTDSEVRLRIERAGEGVRDLALAAGECTAVPAAAAIAIAFDSAGAAARFRLEPDAVYFFARPQGQLVLGKLDLAAGAGAGEAAPPAQEPAEAQPAASDRARQTVVPVKILVDDDERSVQQVWEKQLRARLAAASEIFQRACRVRFDVVAAGTWESDNTITDFDQSLLEFCREVSPRPAVLAIGFTSQYTVESASSDLGSIRAPLDGHVLVRQWARRVTEAERLVVLVHELGHYLGAVHSADADSVMFPRLANHGARAKESQIGFDPINLLAMNLVAEQLPAGGLRDLRGFPARTRQLLCGAYQFAARTLPGDTSAPRCLALLEAAPEAPAQAAPPPLVAGTRKVVEAIFAAAEANHQLPDPAARTTEGPGRLSGDGLTEHLFRRGAAIAAELPADVAVPAYLLGLGIAVDDSDVLRKAPLLGPLVVQAESEAERARRLAVLGEPTMRGRRDLCQHFVVCAALSGLGGPQAAETVAVLKEVRDAQGGSGFSFVDLVADLAGVTFATRLHDSKLSLATLSHSFAVPDFLPERGTLREGLSWAAFTAAYGSVDDDRFRREVDGIRQRILALPGY